MVPVLKILTGHTQTLYRLEVVYIVSVLHLFKQTEPRLSKKW